MPTRIRLPQPDFPTASNGGFRSSGRGFITPHLDQFTGEGVGEKAFTARTGGRFIWEPPLRTMQETFGALEAPTIDGALVRLEQLKDDMVAFMRDHHVWVNRSRAAEESLTGLVWLRNDRRALSLAIFYDVETLVANQQPPRDRNYSVFLETMQAGKFAIIGPTIEHFQAEMMLRMQGMWSEEVPF